MDPIITSEQSQPKPQTVTPAGSSLHKSNTTTYLMISLIILLSLSLGINGYLLLKFPPLLGTLLGKNPVTVERLPVTPTGKPFENSSVVKREEGQLYRFETEITDINRDGQIIVNVTDNDILPQIILGDLAQVFHLTSEGKRVLVSIEDLKPKQRISVYDVYRPELNHWILQSITITSPVKNTITE